MFPALVVQTPAFQSAGSARRMEFVAPRSLKEPIGCRHSSFEPDLAGSVDIEPDEGLAETVSAVVSRARSIASSGIRSRPRRRSLFARPVDAEHGRREVLDRDPERLEERQLRLVPPPGMRAREELAELGKDVVGPDAALLDGAQVVARLVQRRLAAVDEQRGVGDDVCVELPG